MTSDVISRLRKGRLLLTRILLQWLGYRIHRQKETKQRSVDAVGFGGEPEALEVLGRKSAAFRRTCWRDGNGEDACRVSMEWRRHATGRREVAAN